MLQTPPAIIGNCMNLDVELNTYVMKPDHEESVICANQALKVQHTETIQIIARNNIDLSHQNETATRNGGGEVMGLEQSDQEDGHYPDSPDITSCKSIYESPSSKRQIGSDEVPKENTIVGLSYLDPNPTPIATKSPPLDFDVINRCYFSR